MLFSALAWLMSLHSLQEKDGQLQSALEQLTEAAKERARLRQDLISAQVWLSILS